MNQTSIFNNQENLTGDIGKSAQLFYELYYQSNPEVPHYHWETPVEFDKYNLPTFNVSIFSKEIQEMILAVSEFNKTPIDLAAFCGLGALSTAIQGKFIIEPWSGWQEPLNLYLASLLPSSSRKTPVFKAMTAPIKNYETALIKQVQSDNKKNEFELKIIEKRFDKLENAYLKSGKKELLLELEGLRNEQQELEVKSEPIVIADDFTEEALIRDLKNNNEQLSIMSSEGDLFEKLKSDRLDQSKMAVYLKSYNGELLRVSRITRDGERLESPLLTICISAQPAVIRDTPAKLVDRGLIPRFLFSIPFDGIGYRECDIGTPIDDKIKEDYSTLLTSLLNLKQKNKALILSKEAIKALNVFRTAVEAEYLNDGIFSKQLKEWGGKFVGQLLRIAGIIHITDAIANGSKPPEVPEVVEVETLNKVLSLANYFIQHAAKAYGCMKEDTNFSDAEYLLEKIQAFHTNTIMTEQEIWQKTKSKFKKSSELRHCLQILIDRRYIRHYEFDANGIRIPRKTYQLNPYLTK